MNEAMDVRIVRYCRWLGGMFMSDIIRALVDHGYKEREINMEVWRLCEEGVLVLDMDRKFRVCA